MDPLTGKRLINLFKNYVFYIKNVLMYIFKLTEKIRKMFKRSRNLKITRKSIRRTTDRGDPFIRTKNIFRACIIVNLFILD